MSDIQMPVAGQKSINLKSTDLCGNTTRGARIVNIIQKLQEGRYIVIDETGDIATISADISSDYYNKYQINELIGDLDTVKFKVVAQLPAIGAENVIYLVPKTAPDVGYDQYIWDSEDTQFYPIGDTDIDLSEYYTKAQVYNKTEIDTKLDEKQDKLTAGTDITPSDSANLSYVDLGEKKVSKLSLSSLWTWIKDKMTGAISSCITDDFTGNRALVSTPLGKISYSNVTHEELDKLRNVRSNVQEQIDDKQDELSSASEITSVADSTELSSVSLTNKTVAQTKALTLWNYIKSKITNATITSISDSTKIGSIDTSKSSIVQETTAKDMFDYMWKKIYPVGSIYTSTSSTSPATLFGGTWERINGRFLVGAGNNGATGDEALNLTAGTTGGVYRHQHEYGVRYGAYYGQPTTTDDATTLQLKTWNSSNTQSWSRASQKGNVQGRYSSWSGEGSISNMEHTAYTKLVNNLPPYLVVYFWKRVS